MRVASRPLAGPPRVGDMRMWTMRAVLGLGWCGLLVGIAGIVLHLRGWRSQWPALAASGASYFMLGALVALLLFLIVRGWRSAAVAGVVVAAVVWTQLPAFVPDGRAASGPELRVLQSNLLFGGSDLDAVVGEVRGRGVELLTVQELTPDAAHQLTADLAADLPYHHLEPGPGGAGTGIFSRYPLHDTRKLDGFLLANLSATMDHPQRGPVTVFAVHPVPPPMNFPAWSAEMRRLREVLDVQQGPAVVGGDFNATMDHALFRDLLRGRFASAAELAGAGPLPTWPADRAWGPVIGIDHVLVADGGAGRVESITIPGSDHRAVYAELRLPV
ncbi:endonuclease/exonuclease/phosphatase family protein [Nocardia farcinica]|nr:endonuclease/exonuclease/phosphatase family protein [Nocardia farcinica]PEH74814.1 endonuclease [Nocardia sp. FDAARGOS_372]MBF6254216.1 endonuclease/exonuclease/phosphatase family protein [Nocardia farcinica]MBF6313828.1 endonuclease/exonuclease/phosphatase family protein [Nocardia farcinica]MBF6409262.1 endonuclease/exonuclease/phosphatase family protein [Nocardia farcinica]